MVKLWNRSREQRTSDGDVLSNFIPRQRSRSTSVSTRGESDDDCWRTKDYEDALQQAGFGTFQYMLALICGWANASDAVEILSVSFILTPAQCEMGLSSGEKGLLSSIVFVGMMVGGYFWGYLADKNGRRQVLVYSLTFNAVCAIISSLIQTYPLFVVFRFLSGVGVGGSIPVVFSYFAEFQPKQHRGKMISVVAFFWMCGNIVAAALAWIVIPTQWGYSSSDPSHFQYPSWRIFITVCTIPSLSSAIIIFFMPESPKFLIHIGDEAKALRVLSLVFSINKRSPRQLYPVKSILLENYRWVDRDVYDDDNNAVASGSRYTTFSVCSFLKDCVARFFNLWTATFSLFKPPLTRRTIVLVVQMFTLSFGYYGLWLWLPELLNDMNTYGGSACSSRDKSNSTVDDSCNSDGTANIDNSVYTQSFITSLSNLPGNMFTIFLVDSFGRKWLLVLSMLLSGVSVLFVWVCHTTTQTVLMLCLFGGISVVGWNVLDVLLTELYPTDKRSLAIGFQTMVGRVGSILATLAFGALIDEHCAIPILTVSALLIFGGFLALFLPNMQNKPLD